MKRNDVKGVIDVQLRGSPSWVTGVRVVEQVHMEDLSLGESCLVIKVATQWFCIASFSVKAKQRESLSHDLTFAQPLVQSVGSLAQKAKSIYTNRVTFGDGDYMGYDSTADALSITLSNNPVMLVKPSSVIFRPTTDSASYFRIMDSDGNVPIFTIDSVSELIGVNTATPTEMFTIKLAGTSWSQPHFALEAPGSTNQWGLRMYTSDRLDFGYNEVTTFMIETDGDVIITKNLLVYGGNIGIAADTDLITMAADTFTVAGDIAIGGSNNELRFYEGVNYVGFEAPALAADQIWVLPNADGAVGDYLKTDGGGNLSWDAPAGVGSGAYDLNGLDLTIDADGDSYLHESADDVIDLVLAGAAGEFAININAAEVVTFTAGSVNIRSQNELRFYDNGNYVGFEAPALSADQIWVLPSADGSIGQVLTTNGSGTLSWT